ncbi:MAG: aminopeptidase [Faecalibacterium sp.]|nr:aminopeptidase [Faecalibacterium sp.]
MKTELLEKYADFIVRVGVNVQPGQTLLVSCPLEAAPLARLCVRSAYAAGARDVRVDWYDGLTARARLELGDEAALSEVKPYLERSYLDYAESEGGACVLHILADDPELYAGLDAGKINRVRVARNQKLKTWRDYTLNDKIAWCIAAMPCPAWAKKVFPELPEASAVEALWNAIFEVCRVTHGDPVAEWETHIARLNALRDKMNAYHFSSLHFSSANGTDLNIGLADGAHWESAASFDDRGTLFVPNIPTEEVFTAPHKDHVDGVVYGTKPYAYNSQLIEDFHVTFQNGRVTEYGAGKNEALLGELLASDEGACHIGEVALVPASSPINRSGILFYDTLFDENAACHIAFGASYPGTCKGGKAMNEEELKKHGMNQSVIHEDIMIGAADTTVTGLTEKGETVTVFSGGEWAF